MKIFRLLCFFTGIFGAVLSLPGQNRLGLDRAIQIALNNNLAIQVAQQDALIADKNDSWGNAGYLPNVSAGGSYNRSVVDQTQEIAVTNDTSRPSGPLVFPNAASTNYSANVTASYVIFDGLGRLNNLRKLQLQKDLSETQLRFTIENTLLNLISSFFEVARQEELLGISRESLQLSKQRFERAQAASELGSQNNLARLSALVDLRQDSVNYYNTLNRLQKGRRQLNQALNFPVDTTFLVDTSFAMNESLNYLELQSQAMDNNAALVQAQISKQIAGKDVNIAWSERLPEISASGGYTYSRQESEGGFLRFTESEGWQYGLNAQWNLFSSYRTQTQIETARIRVYQSELQLEQARQQLRVDMANAWLDYQNALKILGLQKRNLKVSRLNFERSREAYKLGQINKLELRQAQLDYINAKAELNNLSYTAKLAEIELKRVAGLLLEGR